MDHLPPVANPYKPLSVKYLGGSYSGRGFTDFIVPTTVNLDKLRDESTSLDSLQSAAPVLQSWFFFGLIHEILQLPVNKDDFIQNISEQQYITTAQLPQYLSSWRTGIDQANKEWNEQQLQTRNIAIMDCLKTSYLMWRSIAKFALIVGDEIELSIQILACTLEHAVGCALDIPTENLPWRQSQSQFLTDRMVSCGWCPALIWQIFWPARLTWQYYCYLLGPPLNHHTPNAPCQPGDTKCSLKLCKTSDKDYEPQHVCEGGWCKNVIPSNAGEIVNIVRENGIPLLDYDPVTTKLVVRPYQKGTRYTAISHVWTDGLGNPVGNSMPQCQLARIHKSIARIPWTNEEPLVTKDVDLVWQKDHTVTGYSQLTVKDKENPLLFWIDTICVPREPDLRCTAIESMRVVYNRANRVLVFDAELTRISGNLGPEEIFSRISISNWIRRFWTLQEGVLAKALWFQFGDEAYISLTKLNPEASTPLALYNNEVKYHCEDFDFDWQAKAAYFSPQARVGYVWSALQNRISSFEEDQPVCIATLLDMDIHAIQSIPGPNRFTSLWQQYKSIPTGVLFIVAPKLQTYPLRWAPASISSLGALPSPGTTTAAIPTPEGLLATHHGIITTTHLTKNRHGVLALHLPSNNQTFLIRQNLKQNNLPWEGLDLTSYTRLAVLLAQPSITHDDLNNRQPFERSLGALVGIIDGSSSSSSSSSSSKAQSVSSSGSNNSDHILKATYLRAVSVLLQGSVWEYTGQREWEDWEEQEKQMLIPAEFTPAQQRWLIT